MKNSILRIYPKVYHLGIPIPYIIKEEIQKTNYEVALFYEKLFQYMQERKDESLNEIMNHCSVWKKEESNLKREEWDLFIEALQVAFDRQQMKESRALESYISSFEEMICDNRREHQQERKVTVAVTMLGAMVLLCILI